MLRVEFEGHDLALDCPFLNLSKVYQTLAQVHRVIDTMEATFYLEDNILRVKKEANREDYDIVFVDLFTAKTGAATVEHGLCAELLEAVVFQKEHGFSEALMEFCKAEGIDVLP